MKKVHFCMGLPRSGSTVLMNILNENPKYFCTGTDPIPSLIQTFRNTMEYIPELVAMDMNSMAKAFEELIKHGTDGWYESMTDKPEVFSKSRVWIKHLPAIFKIFKNPKIIICLRDPRDIIVSYDKIIRKYPHLPSVSGNINFRPEWLNFETRIDAFCFAEHGHLGEPLRLMPSLHEYVVKYPDNFYIFKYESFCKEPHKTLADIYDWLGDDHYEHDLDNIKPLDYTEHDNAYMSWVTHNVEPSFAPVESEWKSYFTEEQSNKVLHNLNWFYKTYYPECLNN